MMQREPRERCPAFLAFLRTKPCSCGCGRPAPSQAAHIRIGWKRFGEKPHDRYAVPLNQWCHLDGHEAQHRVGENEFWARRGINPFTIAGEYWQQFCSVYGTPRITTARPRHRKRPSTVKRKIPSRPLRAGLRFPPRGARPFRRKKL